MNKPPDQCDPRREGADAEQPEGPLCVDLGSSRSRIAFRGRFGRGAGDAVETDETLAADDDQERRGRFLLLGKGAVRAYLLVRGSRLRTAVNSSGAVKATA
jgi:hypothetical protein